MTMLLLISCASLHAQTPASPIAARHEVALTVQRGDCASPGTGDDWKVVKSAWRADGSLEVTLWDSETQTYSVIDDSASVDASVPGALRLFYRTRQSTLPPDAPVFFCEDWVKLTFVIRGLSRAPYQVTVESTQVVRQAGIDG
ncbi:hypothetical protein [Noviluteimonas gilva]|nr:hypothetical protein [Lysobacter gilvus]